MTKKSIKTKLFISTAIFILSGALVLTNSSIDILNKLNINLTPKQVIMGLFITTMVSGWYAVYLIISKGELSVKDLIE